MHSQTGRSSGDELRRSDAVPTKAGPPTRGVLRSKDCGWEACRRLLIARRAQTAVPSKNAEGVPPSERAAGRVVVTFLLVLLVVNLASGTLIANESNDNLCLMRPLSAALARSRNAKKLRAQLRAIAPLVFMYINQVN